jgi:hypothetical protein
MSKMNRRFASGTAGTGAAPAPWLGPWADLPRMQWQALLDWQSSMLVFQKDFWEQWAYRYGSGPIDR